MYAIYKQTHPPTGVEHSAFCHFFSSNEANLVVAGTTSLRVYRFYTEDENAHARTSSDKTTEGNAKKKLELLNQYSLFGNIESLDAIQLAGNSRDSLLLSFNEAKLAIIEYDPATHDIKTRSLHFFEDDEIKGSVIQQRKAPIVRVDPERRCAVMLIYGSHLVVLPFRQEGLLDEHDPDSAFTSSADKSPVLPSYTIALKKISEKLSNVVDIQFLHGYYEPTLLILYEPIRTWVGRLAMRQDTCALVAISLNMAEKVNPVIWSLGNLPFDCNQVIAVPKPIGGVLVCATNSLLYLNQSVPPYGVSLNSLSQQGTSFPLRPQEDVLITLDRANALFISTDKLVFSLKGGEIYVVTLVADGVRSVRSFNFDKAAASVLTACICECGDGYLFLGSRLGNSLLVKYTEKPQDTAGAEDSLFSPGAQLDVPQAKRRRLDTDYAYALDDLDELEVYGKQEQSGIQLTSYTFEVCDSLLNIGPCSYLDIGEPAFQSEEFSGSDDVDLELVACSGYGKNGALTVLQRSVRPQVVTTFELPGCTDMWTVLSNEQVEDGEEKSKDGRFHSFLILSREDSSMVLKTEQEIMELDHSGFSIHHPTVFAGNLGGGSYILQVTPQGVRLLEGVTQVQHIPMDAGLSSIVWCSLSDPYAVMLTNDGSIILLEFSKDSSGPKLTVSRPQIGQGSKVCSCCMYEDTSGLFTTERTAAPPPPPPQQPAPAAPQKVLSVDDEDDLLYGDSSLPFEAGEMTFQPEPRAASASTNSSETTNANPTFWCFMCRENGVLEVYSVPDFKLVFVVKSFNMAPRVLVDSGASSVSSNVPEEESLLVREVLVTGLGYKSKRPFLVALVDQDLLVYEAFRFTEASVEGHLSLRFRKLQHSILIREKKSKLQKGKAGENSSGKPYVASLRVFRDISSYSGVFVCGTYPLWLFITNRGAIRSQPMNIDGAVTSFAPFHNVNCPKGFLYFNKMGELRISVLPTHLSYDAPWPVRKVPLRCTPLFAAYNRESKTYAVVTSLAEPSKTFVKMNTEEREFEQIVRDERFLYPSMEKFVLQLISPVSWEVIPNTRFELDEWEHVTTCKNLMLCSQETHTGRKGFICVGTTHVFGEEITCRGRILIFDIIEVVPEPGQPLTKNKFKMLYGKEQKGPVSALGQVNGYLVSAIGQKIYVWNFKDNNDLVGMAFIDTQLYIHNLVSIKNLIIAADVSKSVTLLRLQEETKTLAFVSKDQRPLEVYSTDFLIDGSQLGVLVADEEKNLVLFTYQPEALESMGGQRLLQRADINIGSHVTSFFRIRAKTSGKSGSERNRDLRQLTYFGTLDGALGLLLPMPEKTYRRLHMLQTKLVDCIPHIAGLNPKAFRLLSWKKRTLSNPHKNVLDWDLLAKFIHLGVMERLEVTKKIGTTPAQILDDLMDVERACAHF